jgi:hypothetical protein
MAVSLYVQRNGVPSVSQQEEQDAILLQYFYYCFHPSVFAHMDNKASSQGDKKMKREDKVLIGACSFPAMYAGFLYWGTLPAKPKPTFPYPDLFNAPKGKPPLAVLKVLRPDPMLTAHPDGSIYWRAGE